MITIPFYQGNTPSHTIAILYLVNFLSARKMMLGPSILACRSD